MNRRLFLSTVLASGLDAGERPLDLGGARFLLRKRGWWRPRWRFYWPHGDETTARQLMEELFETQRGVYVMTTSSERLVQAMDLRYDPNRVFSRAGSEANLKRLNPGASERIPALLDALDRSRPKFLKALTPPSGGVLMALHNNARGYSIATEIPISDEVAQPRPDAPHEFILCSDPSDFRRLARSGFNAVLQQKPRGADDGSLSRWAASRGIRYLNIEAGLGKLADQRAMLAWCLKNLRA
jgi:hypothetical protein